MIGPPVLSAGAQIDYVVPRFCPVSGAPLFLKRPITFCWSPSMCTVPCLDEHPDTPADEDRCRRETKTVPPPKRPTRTRSSLRVPPSKLLVPSLNPCRLRNVTWSLISMRCGRSRAEPDQDCCAAPDACQVAHRVEGHLRIVRARLNAYVTVADVSLQAPRRQGAEVSRAGWREANPNRSLPSLRRRYVPTRT